MLTVLGEAERFGAVFANGAEVTEVIDEDGRAAGVVCVEAESASGSRSAPTTSSTRPGSGPTGSGRRRSSPRRRSRGSAQPWNPRHDLHRTSSPVGTAACIVPAGEERTIFALPWYGRALVGTTDSDYEGDIAQVQPSGDDIEYLLDAANSFFGTDLGPGDLTGAYAGVRPLISTGDPRKSVDISRRAELYETSSGMLTITGGKLTTWRRMAKQVVDRMVEREGREAPVPHRGHPARDGRADAEDLEPPGGWRSGPPGRMTRPAGVPVRARRAPRCSPSPPSAPSSRARSSRAIPTCLPRR